MITPILRGLALIACLACVSSALLAREASSAVAHLTCEDSAQSGAGTVVALDEHGAYVLTAAHVMAGCSTVLAGFTLDLTKAYAVDDIVGIDPNLGLALFRIASPPPGLDSLMISRRTVKKSTTVDLVTFRHSDLVPLLWNAEIVDVEGSVFEVHRLMSMGIPGGPVLVDGLVVGLVIEVDGRIIRAIQGPLLRFVLEAWVSNELLPVPIEDIFASLNGLAHELRSLDRFFDDLREIQERIFEARERTLGARHPETTKAAWNLLLTVSKLKDEDAALELLTKLNWLLQTEEDSVPSGPLSEIRLDLRRMIEKSRWAASRAPR